MLWNILITVLVGFAAGWIAGKVMNTSGGFWFNVILGLIGSVVGRLIAAILGITAAKVSIGGILISVAGACLVIWLVRKFAKKL